MTLERGFRRLVVIVSITVLAVGVALGLVVGSLLTFIGVAGALVVLLWLIFYAVRWVVAGFTSGGA